MFDRLCSVIQLGVYLSANLPANMRQQPQLWHPNTAWCYVELSRAIDILELPNNTNNTPIVCRICVCSIACRSPFNWCFWLWHLRAPIAVWGLPHMFGCCRSARSRCHIRHSRCGLVFSVYPRTALQPRIFRAQPHAVVHDTRAIISHRIAVAPSALRKSRAASSV